MMKINVSDPNLVKEILWQKLNLVSLKSYQEHLFTEFIYRVAPTSMDKLKKKQTSEPKKTQQILPKPYINLQDLIFNFNFFVFLIP